MDDPGKGVASHDEYSAHIVTATRPETDGPSVPIVMVIGHMWLLGRLRNDRGWHSTCVYEEGWHIASGPPPRSRAPTRSSRAVSDSPTCSLPQGNRHSGELARHDDGAGGRP